jgi:hypothetical protein
MILDIPGPLSREIRDKIDTQKVWAVVDSAKPQDLAICQAYMEEWGIPLTNIVEVNLTTHATARLEDWWANVGSVVLSALPEDYEAIFCSPNAPIAWVSVADNSSGDGVATSRMLGGLKLLKAYIDYTGVTIDWALVLPAVYNLIKYIPDPSITSTTANIYTQRLGAPLITGDYAWTNHAKGQFIDHKTAIPTRIEGSNWFGVQSFSNAVDTSRLLQSLDIDGVPALAFYGLDPVREVSNPSQDPEAPETIPMSTETSESLQASFLASLAPIDFDLFKIPVLNEGEERWDLRPCWRLGFKEKGQAGANDRVMTPEDARALARRSKSTSGTIRSRAGQGNAISSNNAAQFLDTEWNAPGLFYWFDHLIRNLGLSNTKLGYHYTPTATTQPWLYSGNPYNIPTVTGLSRYSVENMNYRYNNNLPNKLQPLNGTIFPIPVGNFFYDGINRNTAYYNNKDTDYQYFEPGTPHQLYNLSGGPVGFSTPSHSLGQGGEFIRAGGVAYYGSYAEPRPDPASQCGTTFFVNLLRGHQAATAGVILPVTFFSQEEVLGDGLATPFEFEPINYIPPTSGISSFELTVGAYNSGTATARYGYISALSIGSVDSTTVLLASGAGTTLYELSFYTVNLQSGDVPTLQLSLEAVTGVIQNTDEGAFNNITIQKNGELLMTLYREDADYETIVPSSAPSSTRAFWAWEYVASNPLGTTTGELRDVILRVA